MLSGSGILSTIMFLVRLLVYTLIFIFFEDISNILSSLFKNKRIAAKLKKFAIDHDFPLLSNVIIQVREDKFIKIERTLCVWLPLTRELAAKLTEGENIEFQGLSPTSSFYHCVGAYFVRPLAMQSNKKPSPAGKVARRSRDG